MPIFENLFRLLMEFFRCAKEIIMQHNLLQKYLFCSRLTFACYSKTLETSSSLAIHREAPPFVDQSTEMEMLVTGIKVHNAEFL